MSLDIFCKRFLARSRKSPQIRGFTVRKASFSGISQNHIPTFEKALSFAIIEWVLAIPVNDRRDRVLKHYINGIRAFKAKFLDYTEKVTAGLSLPEKKFCFDMVWGILRGGNVLVPDISRAIGEALLDSTEKRLERQLKRFCYSALDDAVMERVFSVFSQPYLMAIDESDIGKESSFAMEDLDSVRDGSKQGDVFHKGYHMTGLAAIGGSRRHVTGLMMNIYSAKSHGFLSVNEETQNALKRVFYVIGGRSATVTADRGYDDEKFMNFVDSYQKHYVVRAKSSRKYTIGRERRDLQQCLWGNQRQPCRFLESCGKTCRRLSAKAAGTEFPDQRVQHLYFHFPEIDSQGYAEIPEGRIHRFLQPG